MEGRDERVVDEWMMDEWMMDEWMMDEWMMDEWMMGDESSTRVLLFLPSLQRETIGICIHSYS